MDALNNVKYKSARKKNLEKESEQTQNTHIKIPWFGNEDLRSHTKAIDGYIFSIIINVLNILQ